MSVIAQAAPVGSPDARLGRIEGHDGPGPPAPSSGVRGVASPPLVQGAATSMNALTQSAARRRGGRHMGGCYPAFGARCTAWEDGRHGCDGSTPAPRRGPLVSDGGMGTSLIEGGAAVGAWFEAFNLTIPIGCANVHRAFVAPGRA